MAGVGGVVPPSHRCQEKGESGSVRHIVFDTVFVFDGISLQKKKIPMPGFEPGSLELSVW